MSNVQKYIEHIEYEGQQLAIIVRHSFQKEGIEFFTPGSYSQQLGYMNRAKGYEILPHVHNPVKREVQYTQEVLFIKSGRVRVDFYNDSQQYVESRILEVGDVIFLSTGGHGFQMIEDTEMIEVKQGPYAGDEDKTQFDPIESSAVRLKEVAD
jgi:mannose-6-phosphate isomerase-like protein (cupin superfamily)